MKTEYEKAEVHSQIVSELISKVQKEDCDTDREIFVITVGDIVECIADVYGEASLKLTIPELERLIARGIKATEWLMWLETITDAIKEERSICHP